MSPPPHVALPATRLCYDHCEQACARIVQKSRSRSSAEFFHSYAGIFHGYAGRFTKKAHFRPKSHRRTFSTVTMKFRTFSTLTSDFSTLEVGIFGRLVLILFYSYDGNPKCVSSLLYNIALVALLACRKARYPQRVNIDRLCPPQHHFFGDQASYGWRLLYSVP
jgi:hypothetical protein